MTGFVPGSAYRDEHGWAEFTPDRCPMLDAPQWENTQTPVYCVRRMGDGTMARCIYLVALCDLHNSTRRVDLTGIWTARPDMRTARAGAVCGAARRNRPPGC